MTNRISKMTNRDLISYDNIKSAVKALDIETADNKKATLTEAVAELTNSTIYSLALVRKYGLDFSKSRDGVRIFKETDDGDVTLIDSWKRSFGIRANTVLKPEELEEFLTKYEIVPHHYNKRAEYANGDPAHPLANLSSSAKRFPSTAYINFADYDKFVVELTKYLTDSEEEDA